MQRTMKKLKHLRTNKLSLVFTCNLSIWWHQSDLFTFLVYFLVSAACKKKCTSINNGVILDSYNKSRLKQATSVMFNSLPFLHRACKSAMILTYVFSILIYLDTHKVIPVFWMYTKERQSVNKSSSPKKTTRFINCTLTMCKMNWQKYHVRGEKWDAKLKCELKHGKIGGGIWRGLFIWY